MTTETPATTPDFAAKAQFLAAEWLDAYPQRTPELHERVVNGLAARVLQAMQEAYKAGKAAWLRHRGKGKRGVTMKIKPKQKPHSSEPWGLYYSCFYLALQSLVVV